MSINYPPPCLRHAWREVLRGCASDPSEILCRNSRRAWKVTESDFPQEESLKVTILTGGVSAKLAGRAFRLDENTVRGPNVAKTLGGDPPLMNGPPLWAGPAGDKIRAFFHRCSECLSEPPFSRCRGQPGGPWTPKRSLKPHFGLHLGGHLAPNWR